MKNTIDLLKTLNVKDSSQLSAFVNQLKEDMLHVSPEAYDVIALAENLLTAVLKIVKSSPLQPKDLCKKLLAVFDALPPDESKGFVGLKLSDLYSCLNTFAHHSAQDIAKDLIGYRMIRILKANAVAKILKEELRELSWLLTNYFEKKKDIPFQIKRHLKGSPKFQDYRNTKLPSITQAINTLLELQSELKNEAEFAPGISFVINQLQVRVLEEQALQAKASKIIEEMEENCKDCQTHLKKIILKAITKNAPHRLTYGTDVDKFVNDFMEEKNPMNLIEKNELSSSVSEEVRIAVRCYHATNILLTKLTDTEIEPNPIARLKNAKDFYRDPDTQKTFKSNPDNKVKQFFKIIGHLFGQLFTIGYGNFFMLPQAKLHKLTDELFNIACKRGVLPNSGLVN